MAQTIHRIAGTVQTTTGNATVIASYTMPASTIASMDARVMALATGVNGAAYWLHGVARSGGGVTALIGTTDSVVAAHESASAASWSADITANNGAFKVEVTGNAGVTINWFTHATIVAYA